MNEPSEVLYYRRSVLRHSRKSANYIKVGVVTLQNPIIAVIANVCSLIKRHYSRWLAGSYIHILAKVADAKWPPVCTQHIQVYIFV